MPIMAVPLAKRRKVEHTSSDSEDDDASFASFGKSEDEEVANGAVNEEKHLEETDMDGEAEESEDGMEDEDEDNAAISEKKPVNGKSLETAQKARDGRSRSAKAAPDLNGGAYSANTFKSNMFKLQVDELLLQIRPRRDRRAEVAEQALHTLKKAIEAIPARSPLSVEDAERSLLVSSKVVVPFPIPRPPKDAKYKLEYAKPSKINVIGSHALKTVVRSKDNLEIDMTLTMPANLFQDKDYLNHRYFYKRAYYIACVAAELKAAYSKDFTFRFDAFRGDTLKPVLAVTPRQQSGVAGDAKPAPRWQINLIPCLGAEVFAKDKLLPGKNCVRSDTDSQAEIPTPAYNSSLQADTLTHTYLQILHKASTSCAAFRDACLLGTTWLGQRGFSSTTADGGFGSFEWSTLIALLLQGGGPGGKSLLSEGYSSYQLFKATLQLLAIRDISRHCLQIGENGNEVNPVAEGKPMVWDANRSHDLLYKTSRWTYKLLRQEANVTLRMLGDPNFDSFDEVFITRADNSLLRFDLTVQLPVSALLQADATHDHATSQRFAQIYEILERGLGDRTKQINLSLPRREAWEVGSKRADFAATGTVTIGLSVNPTTADRTVDHGPPAENKAEAASFREFWGDKAELRRFKDGSILESLIWQPSASGRTVVEQIVRYIFSRHVGERASEALRFIGNGFATFVKQSRSNTGFQPLSEAYKKLEHDIRGLEELPLSIRVIMPADAQLRSTSIALPFIANNIGQQPVPADVTIQFEGSSRWPDDLVAIQRTKIAFLLKLGQLLSDKEEIETRLGLENENHEVFNQGYLEISYDTGATFRLRVHHDREQTLFEQQLKDKSHGPMAKETAATGLASYKRDYIRRPAHTQAITRLCSRHPALSGSIRLMKKWFASHLLANHFSEETIELFVARTFVQPYPWQTPSSVHIGFLRTLRWLARWDWKTELLIVDLSGNNDLKQADRQTIQTNFQAWRKLDPSLNRVALFAASNVDQDGTTWTDSKPAKVVAGRMTALARAAATEIDEKKLDLEPASLFVSPLSDFDFVLHLKSPDRKNGKQEFKNLQLDVDDALIGFAPVRDYLAELEQVYGSSVWFFWGGNERAVIAGLWSPQTAKRSWRINLNYSMLPIIEAKAVDVQAEINKEAVLAEIARLGGDLVKKVEVNR